MSNLPVYISPIQEGWTALSLASWKGHTKTIEILIQAGADTNIRGQVLGVTCNFRLYHTDLYYCPQAGLTSLMLATQSGHASAVQTLLEGKADPNITDKVLISVVCFMCGSCITAHCVYIDIRLDSYLLCVKAREHRNSQTAHQTWN